MRTACSLALCLWFRGLVAAVAGEPPGDEYFVKYGGAPAESDAHAISDKTIQGEPLVVLEERPDAIRVALKGGSSGWILRSEIGTLAEVLQDTSRRIADKPEDVELRFFRIQLSLRRNGTEDRAQALADLEHVVHLAPQDVRGYLQRGSLRAKSRQFAQAADDFSRALKIDASLTAALIDRGLAYYGLRDFEAALTDFDAYVRAEPKSMMGYAGRAMAHVELAQYDHAEADFAQAMRLDDKSPLPRFERARMWMRRHDAPAAVNDLTETLKRDSKHLDATIFLATLLACGPDDTPRDGKRAVELATAACKLAGSDFRAVEALAAAHAEAGDFTQAIDQQERAITMLEKAGAAAGAKAAARMRLTQYKAGQPVRLMR